MVCSALYSEKIDAGWGMVVDYYFQSLEEGNFERKRAGQRKDWMQKLVLEMLDNRFRQNAQVSEMMPKLEESSPTPSQSSCPGSWLRRNTTQINKGWNLTS